ncbi:MAG: hypothetical protein Q8L47_03345 [bacterium]|nr:hypothetical protein [bacterium]
MRYFGFGMIWIGYGIAVAGAAFGGLHGGDIGGVAFGGGFICFLASAIYASAFSNN